MSLENNDLLLQEPDEDGISPIEEHSPDSEFPVISHENSLPVQMLRPLSMGDIFNRVFNLYQSHGVVLVQSMGIVYLPIIAASLITVPFALFSADVLGIAGLILGIGSIPFKIFATVAAPAVTAKIVSDSFLGKDVDLWESLDFVWQKSGEVLSSFIASTICLVGSTVAIGTASMILGGFIFFLGSALGVEILSVIALALLSLPLAILLMLLPLLFALSPVVAVIENKSWFDAPKRSVELVTATPSAAIRFSAILIVTGLLTALLGLCTTIPAAIVGQVMTSLTGVLIFSHTFTTLVGLIAPVLLTPATAIVTGLLYYDHRIRYENYSLDDLIKGKDA